MGKEINGFISEDVKKKKIPMRNGVLKGRGLGGQSAPGGNQTMHLSVFKFL